jgi:hypothetical protein
MISAPRFSLGRLGKKERENAWIDLSSYVRVLQASLADETSTTVPQFIGSGIDFELRGIDEVGTLIQGVKVADTLSKQCHNLV